MKPVKPTALRHGDVIGVISPASPPSSEDKIEKGAEYLERLGYCVKFGKHVRAVRGFLAGTDQQRADDVNEMFADKDVQGNYRRERRIWNAPAAPADQLSTRQTESKNLCRLQRPYGVAACPVQENRIGLFFRTDGRRGNVQGDRSFHGRAFLENAHVDKKNWCGPKNPDSRPLTAIGTGKTSGILIGGNLSLLLQ